MSERIPLLQATQAAQRLRDLLAPACERIEIAGSIRRRRADVKDMELVAIPKMDAVPGMDLWGGTETVDRLEEALQTLSALVYPRDVEVHRADGIIDHQRRNGSSYKALEFLGIPVDLFIVRPPAEWGVIFAIRTGPGDWNQRIVTDCQRYFLKVEGGQVLHHGRVVHCPEERDFFYAVGQPFLEPWERSVEKVRITRSAA